MRAARMRAPKPIFRAVIPAKAGIQKGRPARNIRDMPQALPFADFFGGLEPARASLGLANLRLAAQTPSS